MNQNRKEKGSKPDVLNSIKTRLDQKYTPEPPPKPDDISENFWIIFVEAVTTVHHYEIKKLDELITDYLIAKIKEKGCGCPQCVKRAKKLTIQLDQELERQNAVWGTNSPLSEEREEIERAIKLAMFRLWEKEVDAQDDRWEKLHSLLNKVRKDSKENRGKHDLKLNIQEEALKQQLLKEIRALRKKRRDRKRGGKK